MDKGRKFEDRAARLLRDAGVKIITRNYRCRAGEIDLVCRDGDTLVFVEVRFRSARGFASAAASVTPAKQRRLVATARHYLQQQRLSERVPCRIDVVTFDTTDPQPEAGGQRPGKDEIQWVKNAIGS